MTSNRCDYTIKKLEKTDELRSYEELLNKSAAESSIVPVLNEGVEHAAILMSIIFDNAKEQVYMYSNALNPELTTYDVYYNSLEKFLKRGGQVKVALESEPQEGNPIVKLIETLTGKPVVVLNEEQNAKMKDCLGSKKMHFAVADDKMYRLEYAPDQFKATSSFNDPEMSQLLRSYFDAVVS